MAALFLGLIAFLLPMDVLGMEHMFAVHMVQHLLLSLVVPPLILLSLTPKSLKRFLVRRRTLAGWVRFLTLPFVASILFNGNIWIWHAPALMRLMMGSEPIHQLTNLLYLVTALLFWLPLFNLLPLEMQSLSLGNKLAYLFFSDMPMMLIGAGLTFSPPLYAFTMAHSSMQMTVTLADQQLGGLLMWVVGGVFLLVIVSSILFLRWMLQQEKEQRERERQEFDHRDDEALQP